MDRLTVTYLYSGENPKEIADLIRVEQTIEFPFDLAPSWIQEEVVGKIESITSVSEGINAGEKPEHKIIISYNPDVIGGELTQFINVLWGNVSLLPKIKIIDFLLPDSFLSKFKGPRFGVPGLRKMFKAENRPLVTTALKPMGSDNSTLAKMAKTIASAGFDLIKDDHSLANQPWALWKDRVKVVAEAIGEAGTHCRYAPSLNLPADQILEAAHLAKSLGAGALLILPGISGFDALRTLAEDDQLALPIQAHPAALGSLVTSADCGISHGLVFGRLMRLAGADISIFPNFGGRFSFEESQCLEIAESARNEIADMRQMWIAPAGGMSLDRIPEMVKFYGVDTALLIGGALSRGDLFENSKRMVEKAHSYH